MREAPNLWYDVDGRRPPFEEDIIIVFDDGDSRVARYRLSDGDEKRSFYDPEDGKNFRKPIKWSYVQEGIVRAIERFVDDYGNIIIPGYMEDGVYMSRYYFYRGE